MVTQAHTPAVTTPVRLDYSTTVFLFSVQSAEDQILHSYVCRDGICESILESIYFRNAHGEVITVLAKLRS